VSEVDLGVLCRLFPNLIHCSRFFLSLGDAKTLVLVVSFIKSHFIFIKKIWILGHRLHF
jgi:hypothetical protein